MAKGRRPFKNPSIPRLNWVAKTYPGWVWVYTVQGFMLAAGLDHAAAELMKSAEAVLEDKYFREAEGEATLTLPQELWLSAESEIEGTHENTEYDRHIPWLAKSINAYGKGPSKRVRKLIQSLYPDMIMPPDQEFSDVPVKIEVNPLAWGTEMGVTHAVDQLTWEKQVEARDLMYEAWTKIDELVNAFGSIVRWVEESGVNLGDYTADAARAEALEWARLRPKGDVVRGDVVYEFSDGWTFQELSTKKQLECEGEMVDHCVKHYSPSQIGKKYRIFSLRDPDGNPVATLEWSVPREFVYQFKGMSNQTPGKAEVERALEFRLEYIDKNLMSPENKLEQVSHYSPYFPAYAGEFTGGFKGVYAPVGHPEKAMAMYTSGAVPHWDLTAFVDGLEDDVSREFGAGDSAANDERVLKGIRGTSAMDTYSGDSPYGDDMENDWLPWAIWKRSGTVLAGEDELLDQLGYYDLQPPSRKTSNPRKRKKATAKRKVPESKRIIDRSLRLWNAYDDHQIKKNFMKFVEFVDGPMKASKSLKVKTARTKAKRAITKEWKLKGWKKT